MHCGTVRHAGTILSPHQTVREIRNEGYDHISWYVRARCAELGHVKEYCCLLLPRMGDG